MCGDELDVEFNVSVNIAMNGISQHNNNSIESDTFWQNMAEGRDDISRTGDDLEVKIQ